MTHINVGQALDGLRTAVEDRGADFTYSQIDPNHGDNGCYYRAEAIELAPDLLSPHNFIPDEGTEYTPGCIVGYVANLHGRLNDMREGCGATQHVAIFTDAARAMLALAQTIQDGGGSWGEALAEASQLYNHMGYLPDE